MKLVKNIFKSLFLLPPIFAAGIILPNTIDFHQTKNSIEKKSVSDIPVNQLYDYHLFSWGSIEITANNATNCFITVSSQNFKIYANGSILIDIRGLDGTTILKTITFDDYPAIEIAANQYLQNVDDINFTTGCQLNIEGGTTTNVTGEFHIVTIFDNEIHIWSNEGVEQNRCISKVPSLGTGVYQSFFTRGDFWFDWPEQKEMVRMILYNADQNYVAVGDAIWATDGSALSTNKVILPTGVFESHYVLNIQNSCGDWEYCVVCAKNLNIGNPINPFNNFWYSWNGETTPIMDNDGGILWAKMRGYDPVKFNDDYLTKLDDIQINRYILLSTNWPIPRIMPTSLTILGGSTSINTVSGYGNIAAAPYMCQIRPIGADINVRYEIFYSNTTNYAPDFIYINAGGYFSIKPNTWETYPSGQDFDVVAISTANDLVSSNKLTITVTITGTPTPKITGINVLNVPKTISIKSSDGYISPSPVYAQVLTDSGEVPQECVYTLTSQKTIPDWITIDQEGNIYIKKMERYDINLNIRVKATSIYNDAYSGSSQDLLIEITTITPSPKLNNYGLMIGLIAIGTILCLFSMIIWLWQNKNKSNIKKGDREFMKNFGVDKKQINTIKQQINKIDEKDKVWNDLNKIKTKKSLWKKFVDWFLYKGEDKK